MPNASLDRHTRMLVGSQELFEVGERLKRRIDSMVDREVDRIDEPAISVDQINDDRDRLSPLHEASRHNGGSLRGAVGRADLGCHLRQRRPGDGRLRDCRPRCPAGGGDEVARCDLVEERCRDRVGASSPDAMGSSVAKQANGDEHKQRSEEHAGHVAALR